MSKDSFPDSVTMVNINSLIRKAERIRQKILQGRNFLPFIFFYGIPTALVGFGSLFFVVFLLLHGYFNFLLFLPTGLAVNLFLVLLVLIVGTCIVSTAIVLLFSTMWLMQTHLGFPTDEEAIFSDSFIIAKYLMNGERLKAKNEVRLFLAQLKTYTRHLIFNPRRKVYSPEFDLLGCGRPEMCRMLMFSTKDMAEIFVNFGLAMVRMDDPKAYLSLKQLEKAIKEYGEPQ
jgi:hypothetical protein